MIRIIIIISFLSLYLYPKDIKITLNKNKNISTVFHIVFTLGEYDNTIENNRGFDTPVR